jgi:hypothetical protein
MSLTPAEHIAIAERIVAEVDEHVAKRGRKMGQQQAQDLALAQSHALLAVAKQNEARS